MLWRAGDERIDWLLHKKPLFHLHWKDGRVPLDVRNKIVVIRGDLHEPDLGLSAGDRQRIMDEVEYVIHSAASISFFEHIHVLLEQNYEVGSRPCWYAHLMTVYPRCDTTIAQPSLHLPTACALRGEHLPSMLGQCGMASRRADATSACVVRAQETPAECACRFLAWQSLPG